MPKLIPDLRAALIAAARARLLESDSHDLTMRQIASDCSAAVGTVYNYFPSKELLMAAVMLEDWQAAYARLTERAAAADSLDGGIRAVDTALRGFVTLYAPAWRRYAGAVLPADASGRYHHILIGQLRSAVDPLLARFAPRCSDGEALVVTELLLAVAQREASALETVLPVIRKIVL